IQEGFAAGGSGCGHPVARRKLASCWSLGPRRRAELGIQGNLEFLSKLLRIKRTASKIAPTNLQRWNCAFAVVGSDNDLFSRRIFFNVHFAKRDAPRFQEGFCAPTVRAPSGAVHGYLFHCLPSFISLDAGREGKSQAVSHQKQW